MPTDECEECGDDVAITERWFNGVTRMKLCAGCAAFWDHHSLDVPYRNNDGDRP